MSAVDSGYASAAARRKLGQLRQNAEIFIEPKSPTDRPRVL
jgi:hypothetical protein